MTDKQKDILNRIKGIKNLQVEPIKWNGKPTGKHILHDNERFYSIIGNQYVPIPYGDLLARVMEWIPNGIPSSAVANKNLTRAMISIEIPGKQYNIKGDEIKTYVNLLNSLDGSAPVGLMVSPVRVVCQNQFTLCQKSAFINLHYRHIESRIDIFNNDVKILEKVDELVQHQISLAQKLNGRRITTQSGLDIINQAHKELLISKNVAESASALWEHPTRKNDEDRNLWTLFNSITDPLNRLIEEKHNIIYTEKIENVGHQFASMVN